MSLPAPPPYKIATIANDPYTEFWPTNWRDTLSPRLPTSPLWINTFKPLIVPLFFGDAFSTFLLRQFFLTISRELDDAALIDGCRRLGVLFRILLPLTRPALAVVAIFNFTWAWNEFFTPLIYLNSPKLFPITLGLHRFIGRAQIDIQFLMAMTIVSTLIPIAIFFLTQRYFIQGIVITGIKG